MAFGEDITTRINLVSNAAEEFEKEYQAAQRYINTLAELSQIGKTATAAATPASDESTTALTTTFEQLGQSVQNTASFYGSLTKAVTEDAAAELIKIQIATAEKDAFQNLTLGIQNNLNILINLNTVNNDVDITLKNTGKSANQAGQSIYGMTREFLAFMMASYAMMEVERQLQVAYGEKLPQAVQESSMALREISQFAYSGAMIGAMSGNAMLGGGLGALAGGLMALGVALLNVQQPIIDLNKQLDSLGKKDEAIRTLAEITHWSQEFAATALELGKKDVSFGGQLGEYARLKEPVEGLWGVLTQLGKGFDQLGKDVSGTNTALSNFETRLPILGKWLESMVPIVGPFVVAMRSLGEAINWVNQETQKENDAQAKTMQTQVENQIRIQQMRDAYKDLNQTIDSGTKLDTQVQQFSQLSGYTQAQSRLVLELAQKDKEHGAAVLEDTKHIEYWKTLVDSGTLSATEQASALQVLSHLNQQLAQDVAAEAQAEYDRATKQAGLTFGKATETYADEHRNLVVQNAQQELQVEQRTADEIGRINANLGRELDRLSEQRTTNAIRASQERARIERELVDSSINAWRAYTEGVEKAWRELGETLDKADRSLQEAQAKADQQLADKTYDITRTLQDRLTDEAWNYQRQLAQIEDAKAKARQQYADRVLEIEQQLQNELIQLAFNTNQQLHKARTEHDREEIMQKYVFEEAMDERKAYQQIASAQRRLQEELKASEERKKLLTEEYEHAVMVSHREADERLATARREYAQELAAAEQRYQNETNDARRRNQDQLDDLQRHFKDESDTAARRNAEQLADLKQRVNEENRLLNQQETDARNRADAEIKLAKDKEDQELAALTERYNYEELRILNKLELAREAYLEELWMQENLKRQASGEELLPRPNFNPTPTPGPTGHIGLAQGGAFTVPAGFPNDSFLLGLTSGEKVNVQSSSQPGRELEPQGKRPAGPASINFQIYDARDPQAVAEAVRQELVNLEIWR